MEKIKAATDTVRHRLLELLRGRTLQGGDAFTAKEISKALGIMEWDVLGHLPHVARSTGKGELFFMEPSGCLKCGFVFKKRGRFKTPGKCPICSSEEITETRYGVRKSS